MVIKYKPRQDSHLGNIHLCKNCDDTFTGKRFWKKEGVTGHHLYPDDFFAAVEDKCWACLALRAQVSSKQYESLKAWRSNWGDMNPPPNHFTWVTVADTLDSAVVGPRGSFELHVMFGGDIGNMLQEIGRQDKWNIIFPALYLWAQPAASRAGEFPDTIRLVDTTETFLDGTYVTLSHSWGSEPFLTLQQDNIGEMMDGILTSRLSRTFQDSIKVARRMNIRYVWIDSLCIIQNEPDLADWEKESVKMGEYYSGAFCNISATASTSGSEGLRRHRDHTALQHAQYDMPALHGRPAGSYSLSNVSLWATQLDEAPLHRRAWVLQERLLARRVLHFGDGQLLWECREQTASEMYPRGVPKIAALQMRSRFKNLDPVSPVNQKRFSSTDREIVAQRLWHHVAKEYSRCLLTYSKDKSRALQGVVSLFGTVLEDEHLHGLWKKNLHHSLLWRTQDAMYPPPNRLYEVQRQYTLPSWSWLSSDCPLLLRENAPGSSTLRKEQILFQILDASSNNPRLTLKCLLRHAKLQLTTYRMFKVNLITKHGSLEAFRLPDVYVDGMLDGVKEPGDVTSVLLLPARTSTEIRHIRPGKPVMLFECLLITPCEEQGIYRRVGLLRVQDEVEAVETVLAMRFGGFEVESKNHDATTSMHEIYLV
ncbi:hypothetical protein PRZ48_008262 [Zasmidium cellare]|uniref:Heterokaryon incompatibility domain-containing protein n=1 Tax=Zasmidium cellare TaxID=395010 RepID=A0ABR0EFR6_ZASCE|nr:hypothetical protein PRZ48_008262 [Zasmidium cellare]